MKKLRGIDALSAATLLLTVALFALALVEKGLTHDILLEAGVFLVSAKLVIASYKSNQAMKRIEHKLDRLASARGAHLKALPSQRSKTGL